ncbi:Tyrosine recombinase XerD [termite gut metagenome]|uniref:Tyrosine recombinase XerD n=1 Tax=termite gut metagenome TaxID=433724 RepID=A0A5J4S2T0_9ZZZZ
MTHIFTSALATEMSHYLVLLREAGRYIDQVKSSLKSLDCYLKEHNHKDKVLTDELVSAWVATKQVRSRTKAAKISHVKGFAKYLISLGFEASIPETPIVSSDYVPYVFSKEEFIRMVSAADNFGWGIIRPIRASKVFPVLLRILYGCGLRLGEGLSLRWKDIDLENGIIIIRKGKNMKQRLVPMSNSLSKLLISYKGKVQNENICNDNLFESNFSSGKPFKNNSFYEWFSKILKKANIYYSKHTRHERGLCPHCLRHTFVLHSFLKSESEGRKFEDTSAFLSAYLGHDSPKETDKYLNVSHTVYTDSHQRVNDYIGNLFPEIDFDED